MCKIGDIIAVNNFIGDDKTKVGLHYFVVLDDDGGQISGFSFDIVGVVMSSFHGEEHKQKKLSHIENLEINVSDGTINNRSLKNGYCKVDQLFYFNKSKTKYIVVGQVDGDVLICLIELLELLEEKGRLKQNIENLKDTIDVN